MSGGGVTTVTVWICGRCGQPSHLEGGAPPSMLALAPCVGAVTPVSGASGAEPLPLPRHSFKPVLVVVPYA